MTLACGRAAIVLGAALAVSGPATAAEVKNAAGTILAQYDPAIWNGFNFADVTGFQCLAEACGGPTAICYVADARPANGTPEPTPIEDVAAVLDQSLIDQFTKTSGSTARTGTPAAKSTLGANTGVVASVIVTAEGSETRHWYFIDVAKLTMAVTCTAPEAAHETTETAFGQLTAGLTTLDPPQPDPH